MRSLRFCRTLLALGLIALPITPFAATADRPCLRETHSCRGVRRAAPGPGGENKKHAALQPEGPANKSPKDPARNAKAATVAHTPPTPTEQKPWFERWPGLTALGSVLVALFAALLSFDALVLYPTRVKRLDAKLNYIEAQLKELYGPLLAECIQNDSIFRRVELAFVRLKTDHAHYDFRNLTVDDFKHDLSSESSPTVADHRRLFAKFLAEIYVPGNRRRVSLLQHNLHLTGPYPPLSFYLFLTHAAQLESLIMIKERIDLCPQPGEVLDRYKDPYILTPFPTLMTAEVVAKAALLKALQIEYRYRIGKTGFWIPREIFYRQQYFLLFDETLRDSLGSDTDREHKFRSPDQTAHYPPTFPLVWGPYTGVELFELRSWLIAKERPLRELTTLKAEWRTMVAMLQADVAITTSEQGVSDCYVSRPLHHRVSQTFDELDLPGSKRGFDWNPDFNWEDLVGSDKYVLNRFKKCGFTLANLPQAGGLAYRIRPYAAMREIPLEAAEEAKGWAVRFIGWLATRKRK